MMVGGGFGRLGNAPIQNFNVSRTPVAKAFSQLKKDGLIIIKHGGAFVA